MNEALVAVIGPVLAGEVGRPLDSQMRGRRTLRPLRKVADLFARTQSNLSRGAKHLEEQRGIALFERTNEA